MSYNVLGKGVAKPRGEVGCYLDTSADKTRLMQAGGRQWTYNARAYVQRDGGAPRCRCLGRRGHVACAGFIRYLTLLRTEKEPKESLV